MESYADGSVLAVRATKALLSVGSQTGLAYPQKNCAIRYSLITIFEAVREPPKA
jgi:hypothetical protein